ncbi:MAG TPA: tetratricopeptide repeat protein, partial [Planctomycetaceae bacterium]|nr:tetratricopeptide repeat protein [Planctomycetaceae bacterium]
MLPVGESSSTDVDCRSEYRPAAWSGVLLIAVTVGVAFSNCYAVPFLLDDTCSIVDNLSIRRWWVLDEVLRPPGSAVTTVGRPILNLSLALNYAFGGVQHLWAYHAVNVVIHLLAAWTLFGILRRTMQLPSIGKAIHTHADPLALGITLLWAVHPLQVESVTYVVQRAESLVGLFYLLTLYCVLRGSASSRAWAWNSAAVVCCAFGMGTKEVMVSAPVVVWLYDATFLAGTFAGALRQRWKLYLGLVSTWSVMALVVAMSIGRGHSAGFGFGMTAWEYARTQFVNIVEYLQVSVWPSPLILDYGTDTVTDWRLWLPAAIVVGGLFAGTLVALRRCRWVGFLGIWMFAILSPTSSFVPVFGQTGAQHRMYLPLAAVIALLVIGGRLAIVAAFRRMQNGPPAWIVGLSRGLVPALVVLLAIGTLWRNETYRMSESIWLDTVQKRPNNWRGWANLARAYLDAGDLARAEQTILHALKLGPRNAVAHNHLGMLYHRTQRYEAAYYAFSRAIDCEPDLAMAYNNRGLVLKDLQNFGAAYADFNRAITLQPRLSEPYNNRGALSAQLQNFEDALADLTRSL